MNNWIRKAWKENKGLLLFLALMFIFRSAVADWNEVPTGSMKPTIIEGDRVLVNKLAYDLRIPFTHISLLELSEPQRGDIVVFDSKASGKRLIKRVVGVPGDIIQMRNNQLRINSEWLSYKILEVSDNRIDQQENLLGLKHAIRIGSEGSALSSFQSGMIPADQYLVLGDNRDNSADSRVIGLVPREEIIGRSKRVIVSLNYDNFHLPRSDRFWQSL